MPSTASLTVTMSSDVALEDVAAHLKLTTSYGVTLTANLRSNSVEFTDEQEGGGSPFKTATVNGRIVSVADNTMNNVSLTSVVWQ